ncbi:hypothetical protein FJV41_19775 [Myxococcus llanfairpwllgwyngyllgogerychwyrndrobwllllantysiliogogogochensis]|uniref:Immunity MXAN-0049 protein domain-containing protein n=1 Tax=Myxococcus llanfairpwllgwyngyllgogerychwyrndrobwllllantysiliogogogochensis TaxID=2590453 RepID=A0A540WYY4_9BACT|nr:DUF1629 domain-containing protein [Myxococcus llanfairpwllgwyngyllgogerychwyrndrobwllllantysiliogogogochensis]TQF14211.1 hypothetical protein FJV41_19775 [Myxococcus llanfairpwllgwyngyllgogerychwyrndrobwllllantysiliogogogochensis]
MEGEYTVLMRARSQHHPLLVWNQDYLPFLKAGPVNVAEPVQLRLGDPVPRKPVMADHHALPAPVVSPRVRDVLAPLDLHGVQWVPADVQVGEGDVRRYWLMHMWRPIRAMDRARSVFTAAPSGHFLLSLDKLVLDDAVLSEIPLRERLVFMLEEDTVHLVHRTVVDRLMSMTPPPDGLRFVPVEEWDDSAGFR